MPSTIKQTSMSYEKPSTQTDVSSIRSVSTFSSLKNLLPKKSSPKPVKDQNANKRDQMSREAVAMYMAVYK